MRMTTLAVTALTFAAFSTPAFAGSAKPVQVQTKISKTDLATLVGIEKVYTQLQKAAEDSCRSSNIETLSQRIITRRCESRLMNDFIVNVGHKGLTDYHKSRKAS